MACNNRSFTEILEQFCLDFLYMYYIGMNRSFWFSIYLVQLWCNKCKKTTFFAFKQGSTAWICPLKWGINNDKNAVV